MTRLHYHLVISLCFATSINTIAQQANTPDTKPLSNKEIILELQSEKSENINYSEIKQETIEQKLIFRAALDATWFDTDTAALYGGGLSLGVGYAFFDKWATAVTVKQNLLAPGLNPFYTELDLRLTYAITGKLNRKTHRTYYKNKTISEAKSMAPRGLRAEIILGQYFFNTETTVIPFTSTGVAAHYDFRIGEEDFFTYFAGLRTDIIFTSDVTYYPILISGGIKFLF